MDADMTGKLKDEAKIRGYSLRLISSDRLKDIRDALDIFGKNAVLNGFQRWILNEMYDFEFPDTGFDIRTVIIMAVSHPPFATVEFDRNGRKYEFVSLVISDFDGSKRFLTDFSSANGCRITSAGTLPLKRLAAASGLAVYGKNNICYVNGMGSYHSLEAYYSDMPCGDGDWTGVRLADECDICNVCCDNCPTGAIRKDRFLIDNERCLSYFNERPGDFPDWLPDSAHHCLYDCLKCQTVCPMNRDFADMVPGLIRFDEEETEILLSGKAFGCLPKELERKSKKLGLDKWFDAIPRNLKILFELYDHNG
jgi:epoxyqueuosine reductase